jgi:hypothetical protein
VNFVHNCRLAGFPQPRRKAESRLGSLFGELSTGCGQNVDNIYTNSGQCVDWFVTHGRSPAGDGKIVLKNVARLAVLMMFA